MTFGRQLAAIEKATERLQNERLRLNSLPWTMEIHERQRAITRRLTQLDRDYRELRGRRCTCGGHR